MFKVLLTDDNQQFTNILANFLGEKSDIEVVGTAIDIWLQSTELRIRIA